jgi:hypothetical protein
MRTGLGYLGGFHGVSLRVDMVTASARRGGDRISVGWLVAARAAVTGTVAMARDA